jgi:DNA polymerase-3 subunit gamma/tau
MSHFVVSARKYRPVNFENVVGQPSVANTLKSAIKKDHVAHAYLFCGPRGVGKTTCARIFAKTLNCFSRTADGEACNSCESCTAFNESRSFNIHELDAASNNSVDDIRNLIEQVRVLPQVGKYSIYIIDEVHMLSQAAFNAFLKTLEEPPAHAIFILATTEKHKIIPTILSRCQIFDFNRIRVEDIIHYLGKVATAEGISVEEEALHVIAQKADGAMRDALSIFDQVASFANQRISYNEVLENLNVLDYEYYFRMTSAFLNRAAGEAMIIFDEVLKKGFEGLNFVSGLSSHLRNLIICQDMQTIQLLESSESIKNKYREQASFCGDEFLFMALDICNQCELAYRASKNQRLHVEIALLKISNIAGEKKNKDLEQHNLLHLPEIHKKPDKKETTALHKPAEKFKSYSGTTINEPDAGFTAHVKTISIKETLEASAQRSALPDDDHAENEDTCYTTTPGYNQAKSISENFLLICLDAFSDQIRDSKPRTAVTLQSVKPVIHENHIIEISLNNQAQLEDFIANTKNDLEKFLQRELQNARIHIVATLTETSDKQKVKLYTDEEKFRYLNQKNPLLGKFKQELNLELE